MIRNLVMLALAGTLMMATQQTDAASGSDDLDKLGTDIHAAAQQLLTGTIIKVPSSTQPPPSSSGAPAPYVVPPFQPIPYTHLWVSSDGNTHVAECLLQNLTLSSYVGVAGAQTESYNLRAVNATATLLVQLPVGEYNPPHTAPSSQFTTTTRGSWFVQTSDGTVRTFVVGDTLFQDNTATSPAANTPNAAKHISGTVSTASPCNMITNQNTFQPTVDHPCPF